MLYADERPWGRWEVLLDEEYCKVKRIIVKPNQRLSYQKHMKREEVWTIVKGTAIVTINDVETEYGPGSVARIPKQAAHRIANQKDEQVIFIEVQMGDYFGEDDIIRLEDDYGRED
ncbi:phosphomannose isomerase type II C-terminal cupin domain [Candidatus Margulisiibacteriota bacterium]